MKNLFTNELIHETSPYLLQHAHNPVNWCAWNDATWQTARRENKPVIISVGYSACHWCHVMEQESFEDTEVAKLMNEHFVCIKVDREERPDVDQIYMDACQLITGRGGWPLNAIAMPDGRPVYAGTYFPKEAWKQALLYFVDYFQNKREEALQRATEITKGIRQMDVFQIPNELKEWNTETRNEIFKKFESIWDFEFGGRRGAPKFPMPANLQYLLQNYFYTKNEKTFDAVIGTLNNIINGGIYDHVGGGFARYSVDERWEIPHFEKMLYDNAQLVSAYCHAFSLTKNERYREVVYETLEFVEREMSDSSGGFYSALDADSEGEEGKFYVWTYTELRNILQKEFEEFCKIFSVSESGNFENKNHLMRNGAAQHNQKIVSWKNKLLAERSRRIRPLTDDKMLTSWNALMLTAFTNAYKVFADEKFLLRAQQCATFIENNLLQTDYSLKRNFKNSKATISGFLDDYSFTCEAFLSLYEITFNENYLNVAAQLTEHAIQHFYNASTGIFFYTSVNDEPLIARKTETSDNVIPASNSSLAKVLFKLGKIFDNETYISMAKRALNNMFEQVATHPSFYANWASLLDYFIDETFEIVITGEHAVELKKEFGLHFLPNCIFAGAVKESSLPIAEGKYKKDETQIYVCRNKTCLQPVKTVREALQLLN
jgi:uncharacterized protein YyaL (SSP411 family)